jgi:hypothetical protein
MRKTKIPGVLLFAVAVAISGSASAIEHVKGAARYGNAVQEPNAGRTIELRADTSYINVEAGETVRFVSQGKTFAWHFDTLGTPVFKLGEIAPRDANVGNVTVYVDSNPLYRGGAN